MYKYLITILLCLFFAQHTFAATKVGEKFGDWSYACQTQASNKTRCNISQTLVNKKTSKLVLSVVLMKPTTTNELSLIVTAPLGIYIPSGVKATVDNKTNIALSLKRCTNKGCMATAKLPKSLVKKLKAGSKLYIEFYASARSKPITLDVSLNGITKGIAALN